MLRKVMAVYDKKMEAYLQPFFVPTVGIGIRSFADEVNRKAEDNGMNRHPEDYELWLLGEFNDETGDFVGDGRRLVNTAAEMIKE